MKPNKLYISKIVSACLLGDATIRKDDSSGKNRNAHMRLKQIPAHKDHLNYIAEKLADLTKIVFYYEKPVTVHFKDGHIGHGKGVYILKTQNHPFYTSLRQRWYLNGVKHIDPHVCTLLDNEMLAIWYQQDGYITMNRKDCVNPSITLCTDCFTYGDLMMIRRALIEKTGFIFNPQKKSINSKGEQTYRLHLYRKQTDKFIDSIFPYVQPSFYYKLGFNNEEQPAMVEDIVCSLSEDKEIHRNDVSLSSI